MRPGARLDPGTTMKVDYRCGTMLALRAVQVLGVDTVAELFRRNIIERYRPLMGEFAWHSLTVDPTIESLSNAHYDSVIQASRLVAAGSSAPLRILEVGCYAHTTGYMLHKNLGAEVTLYDLSARALKLGQKLAGIEPGMRGPRLIAGDFHNLPFNDCSFDLVFITSALHHTWRWKRVLQELLRVIRGDGILLLENEPCRREACLYMFRTNRAEAFTPFEKEIDRLGLIRTVAEPYPGSRPETLFGMVENQRIPLDRLLATIKAKAELVELQLNPLIGELEQSWLDHRPPSTLDSGIEAALRQRIGEAEKSLTAEVQALGFRAPGAAEIREFSRRLARLIKDLPNPDDPGYRIQLARIFGSPVRLLARMRTRRSPIGFARKLFRPRTVESNGITYCYSPEISRLLTGEESSMPDLQACGPDELARCFSPDQWSTEMGGNGIRSLVLRGRKGTILVAATGRRMLVLLRFYGASDSNRALRVKIGSGGSVLESWVLYGGESFLFSKVVRTGATADEIPLEVTRESIGEPDGIQTVPGHLSVCLAVALAI